MPSEAVAVTALEHKSSRAIAGMLLALALIATTFVIAHPSNNCEFDNNYKRQIINIGSARIDAAVADNQELHQLGLGQRPCMNKREGMLFEFQQPAKHGIWMKDMKLNIDIVWMSAQKKVVGLEKNVSPLSYPKVFYPEEQAIYVLELNAGEADELQVSKGTQLQW